MYRTGEGLTTSDKLGSVSLCDSTKFNAFKGSVEVTEISQMSLHEVISIMLFRKYLNRGDLERSWDILYKWLPHFGRIFRNS